MVTFAIYCDPTPGKEDGLDRFLTSSMKDFWVSQQGVREYQIMRDKLIGYPERSIQAEVSDFSALKRILDTGEWNTHRRKLNTLLARVQSQILEPVI